MPTINDILHLANNSVQVSQQGLQITGNNISNVNTPGYSRQRLIVEPQTSSGPWGQIFAGVETSGIQRVYDSFLDQQAAMNMQRQGYLEGRYSVSKQVESVFDELEGRGISSAMSEFFSSFSALASDPDSSAQRQNVVHKSQVLANHVSTTYQSLERLRSDMNMDISATVSNANSLLQEIADLNAQIIAVGGAEVGEASSLLDQREMRARELAEIMPTHTFTDQKGNLNVLWNGHSMVDGNQSSQLGLVSGQNFGVRLESPGGTVLDVTEELSQSTGGRLAGLVYARDVEITAAMADLDQFAFNLADSINTLHTTGFALDGSTGRNFFDAPAALEGAAGNLSINQELIDDPNLIAAAEELGSLPGDNRIALALSELQTDKSVFGDSSFGEYFSLMIGRISRDINSLENDLELQEMVTLQSENFRQSVSGVSIDEEMVSLIQWQRAFEASAKMVSTIDEMMQTILALK